MLGKLQKIFYRIFYQSLVNSLAATTTKEIRFDAANGHLQNKGTIKQISMAQCSVRVMSLGLVSWLGTLWGRLWQRWLKKILKPHSVDDLEMLAARRRAVIFFAELSLQQCQFEGDLEAVIKALKGCDLLHSSIGHLV